MSEQEQNIVMESESDIQETNVSVDSDKNIIVDSIINVQSNAQMEATPNFQSEIVNQNKQSNPHLTTLPKVYNYGNRRLNQKNDNDDIEEFDTDDEEEEEVTINKNSSEQKCTDNISYEGNKCIYTEPKTGRKLVWNSQENKWCAEGEDENNIDDMKNYEYDGKNYVYTDKATDITYKFIQEKNEWVVKDKNEIEDSKIDIPEKEKESIQPSTPQGVYGFENDTHTYTDSSDGTSYFWDREKNAWFPKVDDDFMARYQMNYGFTDLSSSESQMQLKTEPQPKSSKPQKLTKEEKKAENKRKNQEPPTWFDVDEAHNTTIYLSNLPLDITLEEFKELVIKCGLLARDEKGKDKIKLYTDTNGELKGDARVTYIKIESVDLALQVLDGWKIRDNTISVQRAKFQLKGEYNPSLKPKRKKKDKEKQKKIHQKLLDWRPDRLRGEPLKCERVVILKNLFKPEDFDKEVTLILDYQRDVRSECAKCGEVKKVTIYDRHPEGVVQVSFKEVEAAQACIDLLNGRWFGQRRITAEIWDGKTKYKIRETDEQIEARINKWDEFLQEQDDTEEAAEKAKKGYEENSNTEVKTTTKEDAKKTDQGKPSTEVETIQKEDAKIHSQPVNSEDTE